MDKENVVYTYICIYMWILFIHKNEVHLAFCDNMDESQVHYAEWNKSDRERQILYDPTYMRFLKTENIKTDS